jgi:hypothetical protein
VNGSYLRTYKGLRQGDPLSPILFNQVVEALGSLLNSAKNNGHLRGLAQNLVQGGLTHLQYADDTVLLIENDEESILTAKLILYYFEAMSGLKINYRKVRFLGWEWIK